MSIREKVLLSPVIEEDRSSYIDSEGRGIRNFYLDFMGFGELRVTVNGEGATLAHAIFHDKDEGACGGPMWRLDGDPSPEETLMDDSYTKSIIANSVPQRHMPESLQEAA